LVRIKRITKPKEEEEMMKKYAPLLMSLVMVFSMLLAACVAPAAPAPAEPAEAPAPAEEPEAEAPAAPAADQPVGGGTLRVATNQIIDDVDPSTAWSHVEWCVSGRLLFEGLMEFDRTGKLVPRLAEDWPEVSEDGRTYTFKIREGVKWHNGRDVVADDFKYGLERASDPDTGSWGQSYMSQVVGYQDFVDKNADEIEGIKAIDDSTLEITLEEPQALFLTLLMSTSNFPVPREEVEAAGDAWGKQMAIGNGPYMIEEWIPDQKLVLVRNPDYWDGDRPYLDAQEITMQVEPSVALLQLEKGEIDMITSNLDPEMIRTVKADAKWDDFIHQRPSMTSMWMFMNMDMPPFDDLKVRQAVNHALDRESLIKIAGGGTPLYGVYPPDMPAYDPEYIPYPYDPEKAKALLEEAGYPDGFETVLTYNTEYETWKTVATVVQQQLAEVGIEVELVPLSHTAFIAEVNTPEKVALGFQQWAAVFPDPNDMIGPQFTCDARGVTGANNSYYCNEELESMFAEAESTTDLEKRTELYKQMNEMIMAEAPHVPLFAPLLYMALSPSVEDYDFHFSMYAADPFLRKPPTE
jgi:peptide/nickel transport system substrate-binding protein/oligopeptide transport system substrate-binding protein